MEFCRDVAVAREQDAPVQEARRSLHSFAQADEALALDSRAIKCGFNHRQEVGLNLLSDYREKKD